MIAYLTKSDASEGFNQIIDFLNGSSIKYALTVNPNIYISCIKQFWTSVAVKKVNDVTRLQALVDKKKVIVTEATIREALRLDDAKGIECLPNEEIFVELARMGKQVGDLSSHSTKYTSPALTQKVFANMRRVGKGFFGVDTPLFDGAASDDVNAAVDEPSIPSPTPPTPSPQLSQDIPSTSQRKQKEDKAMKIYQALKRKPQTEAQARKNMMIYLRNVAGFKMDYFKGMTYDDRRPIFEKHFDSNVAFLQKKKEQMDEEDSRALKRINESQEEKAAKKQKLDEEVEELKRHL
uniref:Xylulose kinase-1 n=1 Tax=Tanacetum cinerariifolium TaxID=118510 RepID=A0A6L2N2L2_TANCI|nr:xylulose kinase-1 [Tanacetum cinerariifolium]